MKRLFQTALLLTLFTPWAIAQPVTTETPTPAPDNTGETLPAPDLSDFYLVEVSVFTYTNKDNANEEQWPKDLTLTYPTPLAQLQTLDIEQAYPELNPQAQPAGAEEPEPVGDPEPDNSATEDPLEPALPLPLVEGDYQEHQAAVSRISRSGKHKLLLHKTWLQKLGPAETAPNIILQAGEKAANSQSLGGTIKLYKERYLHLRTNLWLVDYIEAAIAEDGTDMAENNTDTMAANQPENPAAQATSEQGVSVIDASIPLTENPELATEQDTLSTTITDTEWPIPPEPLLAPLNSADSETSTDSETTPETDISEADDAEIAEPVIDRIALMQQKRRMRSLEIHYIDHPLFGILIELRPYELYLKQHQADD